ncbi:MAG: AbrB/MazE/SpoVT family DNA-binding domain-containing protein [Armatimonadota bacterium]|jgi:AbrB family looped-hinge helix DNA binding protein
MPLVRVKGKAQITLPAQLRRALGIEEGDYLEARVDGNRIILIPQTVMDKLPTVTLSDRGEQMLSEALQDVKAGRVKEHDSVESLIQDLHDEADQD